jgi:hypothetical protein
MYCITRSKEDSRRTVEEEIRVMHNSPGEELPDLHDDPPPLPADIVNLENVDPG